VPENLIDFNVRFDYLSGEDSAQPQMRIAPGDGDPLVVVERTDASE
jgi:hypothetical protein